jgi:hypothetical protein
VACRQPACLLAQVADAGLRHLPAGHLPAPFVPSGRTPLGRTSHRIGFVIWVTLRLPGVTAVVCEAAGRPRAEGGGRPECANLRTPRGQADAARGSRAIGSAGERLVHTEEVTGSIPVSPTRAWKSSTWTMPVASRVSGGR